KLRVDGEVLLTQSHEMPKNFWLARLRKPGGLPALQAPELARHVDGRHVEVRQRDRIPARRAALEDRRLDELQTAGSLTGHGRPRLDSLAPRSEGLVAFHVVAGRRTLVLALALVGRLGVGVPHILV